MAKFSGKGSMNEQNVLVTVPNELQVRAGNDGKRFVNLAAELSVLPGHNQNREPQTDTRLTRKSYKDADGQWQQNSKAAYDASVLDKLAQCPSVDVADREGNVYGKMYSVVSDLKPAYSNGKSYGVKMDLDSMKPGPQLPANAQDLQFQSSKAEHDTTKAQQAEAKGADKAQEQQADQPAI